MGIFNRFDITWYEAIDGIGGEQMGYMKDFYDKAHFWEFNPYEDLDNKEDINPFGKKTPLVSINENRDKMIIYYGDGARKTMKINGLKNGEYAAMWFNPRTGEYSTAFENMKIVDGSWELPVKKEQGDWLMVVEIQEK